MRRDPHPQIESAVSGVSKSFRGVSKGPDDEFPGSHPLRGEPETHPEPGAAGNQNTSSPSTSSKDRAAASNAPTPKDLDEGRDWFGREDVAQDDLPEGSHAMPKRTTTRTRRTPEQLIEDLQKKIEQVKARAARAKVRKDLALRHINGAVRSIDKAAKATGDNAVRKALEEARATLAACLAMNGASAGKGAVKPRRAAASRTAAAVDAGDVLTFIKNNPGSSGEQIAEAHGTDTKVLRPVLRELIDAGDVKASGKARGTRYATV